MLTTVILQAAVGAVLGKVAGAIGAGIAASQQHSVSVKSVLLQWRQLPASRSLPETSVLQ